VEAFTVDTYYHISIGQYGIGQLKITDIAIHGPCHDGDFAPSRRADADNESQEGIPSKEWKRQKSKEESSKLWFRFPRRKEVHDSKVLQR